MSRRKQITERKRGKKIGTKVFHCAHCGNRFLATGRQKYCTRSCRNKAYYQASKANKTIKTTRTSWVSIWTNRGERIARLLGKSKTLKGIRYKVQVQGWDRPTWIDEKHLLGKVVGRKGHKKVKYTDPRRIPPEPEENGDSKGVQKSKT